MDTEIFTIFKKRQSGQAKKKNKAWAIKKKIIKSLKKTSGNKNQKTANLGADIGTGTLGAGAG